ncbi:ketol-acid reductoisomerase, partial [Halobacteriales archaeon QH_8_64_26]
AREWITENQANRPTYRQLRQQEKAHEIEAVGEQLRGLFAWAEESEIETEDEESDREEVRA